MKKFGKIIALLLCVMAPLFNPVRTPHTITIT